MFVDINCFRTCTYLRDCVEDTSLWKYVDARSPPNTAYKLLFCTERIHEKTTHLFITSKLSTGWIPTYFFDKIKPFRNLRILSLESQKLNGFRVSTSQIIIIFVKFHHYACRYH